jgi:hypothetical protein
MKSTDKNNLKLSERITEFSASELRKLPKEMRSKIIKQMSVDAIPVYNKYHEELLVDEIGDGISKE